MVGSSRRSSIEGRSLYGWAGGVFKGGRGEGLRGPRGRRSCECCEVDRERRVGDSKAFVGVLDSGRGVSDL